MNSQTEKARNLKAVLLILGLGIAVYSYSFPNPFIWDDEILIVRNPYIRSWQNLVNIFTTPLFRFYRSNTFFYRPLQELTYLLDFQFWTLDTLGYHLTNVFLHVANAVLMFLIIKTITKNYAVSLASSLLFVIHAVHTQAVTYISGRADLLVGVFLLLAFLCYIRSFYLLSIISFIPSLFCKEYALIFPLLLIFYDFTFRRDKFKDVFRLTRYLPFIATDALYIYLRAYLLEFSGYKVLEYSVYNFLPRLFSIGKVIFIYLQLLLYPVNLHVERRLMPPQSFLDYSFILPLLGLAVIIYLMFLTYKRSRITFFFTGWFFVLLLPMLNIIKLDTLIAEHWVYLASIGFFVLVISGLKNLTKSEVSFYSILFLLLIFYSSFTIKRNIEWGDKVKFCRHTLDAAPNSFRANYLLGQILLDEGLNSQAAVQFQKVLALRPNDSDSYNSLGVAYIRNQQLEEARKCFSRATELDPLNFDAWNNLGLFYFLSGERDLAHQYFQKALAVNPLHLGTLNNLGIYYEKTGKKALAEETWNKVLSIDPLNEQAKYNLEKMLSETANE